MKIVHVSAAELCCTPVQNSSEMNRLTASSRIRTKASSLVICCWFLNMKGFSSQILGYRWATNAVS